MKTINNFFYDESRSFTPDEKIEIRDFLIGALCSYLSVQQIDQAIETAFECRVLMEETRKSA